MFSMLWLARGDDELAGILFISAPFGRFFRVLAGNFSARGHQVWRVAWDGGDFAETPRQHRIVFRRHRATYEDFIKRVIVEKRITAIVTYNDTGGRNSTAIRLAKQIGLSLYIIEHGYLRPHWITFDRDGVNGHANLPKASDFYKTNNGHTAHFESFPCRMRHHVVSAIQHFAASLALHPLMPLDTTYYGDSIFTQATGYASEYLWRKTHNEKEKVSEIAAQKQLGKRMFAVILQKPGDAQLRVHSTYGSNNPFLREACESFAASAPADAILVVKQHPFDYGIERTPELFERLVNELNLAGRAFYLRKTSIDIVLDHADGFVTVNSTAGLAAVERGLAVKCCGKAIFDMDGLTFQGNLDSFWSSAVAPDAAAVSTFIEYLKNYTQINGALYAPKGIELASQALCEIISNDFFSPHNLAVAEEAPRRRIIPVPLGGAILPQAGPLPG